MTEPAAAAISVLLFGLTALMALGAGSAWLKVAKRAGSNAPIVALRSAAQVTAAAFLFLGAALAWSAFVALP
jgi:hypothetical protein